MSSEIIGGVSKTTSSDQHKSPIEISFEQRTYAPVLQMALLAQLDWTIVVD